MPKMKKPPHVDAARGMAMEYLPDWLAEVITPESVDPVDVLNPMGMMTRIPGAKGAGEKLLGVVKNRFGPEMQKVMQFAQQRYPRLFGHLEDIRPDDNPLFEGYSGGKKHGMATGDRTSVIGLNEANISKGNKYPKVFGHELHHSAERLARDNFDEVYGNTRKLPNGYHGNSAEILANIQGEKFAQDFDDYLAAGESVPAMKEIKRFKKRPVPGSMAEFQKVEDYKTLTEADWEELDKAKRMMPTEDWLKLLENYARGKK